MVGDIITVWNRSTRPLTFIKDGRSRTLPPGKSQITSDLFHYAREQNPIRGTEDTNNGSFESLVSYVHPDAALQKDPLDTLPAEVLDAMPHERINRNLLPMDRRNHADEVSMPFPKGRVSVEQPTPGMVGGLGAQQFER